LSFGCYITLIFTIVMLVYYIQYASASVVNVILSYVYVATAECFCVTLDWFCWTKRSYFLPVKHFVVHVLVESLTDVGLRASICCGLCELVHWYAVEIFWMLKIIWVLLFVIVHMSLLVIASTVVKLKE